jgi:hypothetical protein
MDSPRFLRFARALAVLAISAATAQCGADHSGCECSERLMTSDGSDAPAFTTHYTPGACTATQIDAGCGTIAGPLPPPELA